MLDKGLVDFLLVCLCYFGLIFNPFHFFYCTLLFCFVIYGFLCLAVFNGTSVCVGEFRGSAEVCKVRSQSGGRYADVPCQEPDVPHSRQSAWEDSILATSQAICRRWGSDGGMDEWSNDEPQQLGAAKSRHRRRMSDTGKVLEWSKSTQANDRLERLCCFHFTSQHQI